MKKQLSFSKRMAKQFSFGKRKKSISGSSRAVTGPTVDEAVESDNKQDPTIVDGADVADAGASSVPVVEASSTAEPQQAVAVEPAVLVPPPATPAMPPPTVDLKRWQDMARAAPVPLTAGFLPSTLIVLLLAIAMYAAVAAGMAAAPPPPPPPAIVVSRGAPWQPALRLAQGALKRVRIGR